jgi:catechol 2,3-dioxygenase-like lactoylglutathione lyase family enzyme
LPARNHRAKTWFLEIFALAASCAGPLLAQSTALAGIAHVAFRVKDVRRTRTFYRTLGFEEAFEFSDPGKPAVSYVKVNDHQFIELYGPVPDAPLSGLLHVCYEATDIEAVWDGLLARGLNPPRSRKARAGNLLFVIHDPEGQLIEFTQYLPGSLHFEDRGRHVGNQRLSRHLVRVALAVQDLQSERTFCTQKLGFEDAGSQSPIRLNIPGKSNEEIELQPSTPETKPRVVFETPSLKRCADNLRSRGFAVATEDDSVSVTDPDGSAVVFVENRHTTHAQHFGSQLPDQSGRWPRAPEALRCSHR